MKALYDNEPLKFESVGNGSFLYRWNIHQVEMQRMELEEPIRTQWECEEVTVWPPITPNKITQEVITTKWDSDYEQKLLNDYNAANMGIYGDINSDSAQAKINAYSNYLAERKTLKEYIDEDCEQLGIK